MVPATPADVWPELVDWVGQSRWIPLTTMRVIQERVEGLGSRIRAEHGPRLGRHRVGITDEMVVTGWEPPYEIEVAHLGPWFTGVGVFTIEARGLRTWLSIRERIDLAGGRPAELAALAVRPLLQSQLAGSLRKFAQLVADHAPRPTELSDPARRHLSKHTTAAVFADEAAKRKRRHDRRRRSDSMPADARQADSSQPGSRQADSRQGDPRQSGRRHADSERVG